jgi:hypothetical protein
VGAPAEDRVDDEKTQKADAEQRREPAHHHTVIVAA